MLPTDACSQINNVQLITEVGSAEMLQFQNIQRALQVFYRNKRKKNGADEEGGIFEPKSYYKNFPQAEFEPTIFGLKPLGLTTTIALAK